MILYIIICICLILNIIYLCETSCKFENDLASNGFVVFHDHNFNSIKQHITDDYVILNYEYVIKGCSLSTYHRDVTSSRYVFKTRHPVYTYIQYFNDGPLLSVCPKSHKTTPFNFNRPITINGTQNTAILFNCDLLHAGCINQFGDKRIVKQYKIAHKDDLDKLKHLQDIKKVKVGECDISPTYEYLCRKISLQFPYLFNHVLTPYLQSNHDTLLNTILLNIYGRSFYNR